MLEFKPISEPCAPLLRKYYGQCTYRLCEYSLGVKLMWREHWHPEFAESNGCLVVLNHSAHYGCMFDFPVPLPGEGDVDAALDEIDAWCMEKGVPPSFGVVPEEERERLMKRYPYVTVDNDRLWQDYIYHAGDLSSFAGRHYSGQRNHINKFHKLYPDAVYRELTPADHDAVEDFWREFHKVFNKADASAKMEVCYARRLMVHTGEEWARTGCVELDGRLIAIALAEVCGETLVCHIEKALPQYEGVYPFIVQSFAAAHSQGLAWINREDDAGDKGLRTSKLQYLPAALGAKVRLLARNELSRLKTVPALKSERLTLDGLREEDKADYNRLCLDDGRNRWWGYDYRDDLKGELTEDYFLDVAWEDFRNKLAVNFAIRLDGKFIGEAVLYRFDYKGGAELGCRILPEYAGNGYGAEAYRRAAEWSLYGLGLYRLTGKCFHENEASRKMLSACMRPNGEDETFLYFEKKV
ncbi:MAG: GNAT family N-acetyltransferase [Oscillospiraceae bacterium]|jgi:RimJ/RimL family protein N-acetyltransferase|nr:GNAT family N-acetyltransferase [Oscillospiraceae bacterium]MDE6996767.1 GNAT family N-acetyltransferase [Oscillospiraceae bacterium]